MDKQKEMFFYLLDQHKEIFSKMDQAADKIVEIAGLTVETLRGGNKLLVCGNGGSASDAQHFAAEIIGRFEKERKAMPAIALNTDTSVLTALGNDYGYDSIFSRQVEGLGNANDCLIGISTSGNSKNVILAMEVAKKLGIKCIGLLGRNGGEMLNKCDIAVVVPDSNTARIQEAHIFIIHFWAAWIERELFGANQ